MMARIRLKNSSRATLQHCGSEEGLLRYPGHEPDPTDSAQGIEFDQALAAALARLDAPYREVLQALEQLAAMQSDLDAFAERRAQALLADHRRVREAAAARGSYAVKALLPPDVIGLFVLLPQVN